VWRLTRHENARKCALDALSEGDDADDPGALWNNKYAPSYTNGGPELSGWCVGCRSDCHSGATVRCIVASESANSVTTVADDGRYKHPSQYSMPLHTITCLLLQFGGMAEQLTRTMKWFICATARRQHMSPCCDSHAQPAKRR